MTLTDEEQAQLAIFGLADKRGVFTVSSFLTKLGCEALLELQIEHCVRLIDVISLVVFPGVDRIFVITEAGKVRRRELNDKASRDA